MVTGVEEENITHMPDFRILAKIDDLAFRFFRDEGYRSFNKSDKEFGLAPEDLGPIIGKHFEPFDPEFEGDKLFVQGEYNSEGNLHGRGCIVCPYMTIDYGWFKNDLKHGKHVIIDNEGNKTIGQYRDDKRHGKFVYYNFEGVQTNIAIYENGKCVDKYHKEYKD